jgi:hypothetical protein
MNNWYTVDIVYEIFKIAYEKYVSGKGGSIKWTKIPCSVQNKVPIRRIARFYHNLKHTV